MKNLLHNSGASPLDNPISKETLLIAGGFVLVYMGWILGFVGLRTDHWYFIVFLAIAYFATKQSRKVVLSFVFFILFWIIYDAMRVFPNYMVSPIHIAEPYNIEKALFGFQYGGELVTPNEYFKLKEHPILDFVAGMFYLTWVPLPMAYAVYLFFKDRQMMLRFSACFLFANLLGFVVYYAYPAAPPWYVYYYGFEQNFDIPGSAAQLSRFDDLVGSPIFKNMYNKNANVFAAIPSLHSAYPVVLLYYGLKKRYKIASAIFLLDVLGIWFAAVYSMHHYIIDVILGAFCAIIAIFVFENLLMSTSLKKLLNRYVNFLR